jgi:hypothetical protein
MFMLAALVAGLVIGVGITGGYPAMAPTVNTESISQAGNATQTPNVQSSGSTNEAKSISVTVNIQGQKMIVSLPEKATVRDALHQLSVSGKITYKETYYSGMGYFINAIEGIANASDGGHYWVFFVNGKKSSVGASAYELKGGDNIEWKFQSEIEAMKDIQ